MRKNRTNNLRRKPRRGRSRSFEQLGTRIALSANGIDPYVLDVDVTSRAVELPVIYLRTISPGGEFGGIDQSSWQFSGGLGIGDGRGPGGRGELNSDPGWRQQNYGDASFSDRLGVAKYSNYADTQAIDTRVVPADVQLAGTNLVLPGLLVSRGDTLTFVITSPVFGLPAGGQYQGPSDSRGPFAGDRNVIAKGLETALPQVTAAGDFDHGDHPLGSMSTNSVMGSNSGSSMASQGSQVAPPPRFNEALSFGIATVDARSAEPRLSGGWTAEKSAKSDGEAKLSSPQSLPATGQWAISKNEFDEGFIELESPLVPRQKSRKLTRELGENSEQEEQLTQLRAFAEQLKSAWNEVWRELGNEATEQAAELAEAGRVVPRQQVEFDANVIAGLVELSVDGIAPRGDLPQHDRQQLAEDSGPVRIDAGVAMIQQFEMATATDAVPPATAEKAAPNADKDAQAETEKPAEARPLSAAGIGVGLVIGVPAALQRRRQDDEQDVRVPRLARGRKS
jgi:hypothetical protein